MWSPEEKLPHRAGRGLESDLSLRYLSPGAFTILPPGKQGPPPEPASNANKHKLTPTAKKNRNAAFAIIAEPGSNPGSRSPSPTGRVSPFRGRGFNPAGSRHVSPLPSPPAENRRFSPTRTHQTDPSKRSKIPTLSRRGSNAALFGDVIETPSPKHRTRLTKQLSQSLTNITPRHVSNKPPPSPRRSGRQPKPPAFQKLSPIIGSSPEPSPNQHKLNSHQQSSPSKIPRSRSQPPSNNNNKLSPSVSGTTSRVTSRNTSRNASRNASREPSPTKFNNNSKINYKNVKAKVNSYSTVSKPKVPPKPQVPKTNEKHKLERKESVIRPTTVNDNNNKNNFNNTNNNKENDDDKKNKNQHPSSSAYSRSKTQTKEGELEDVEDNDGNKDTSSNRGSPNKNKLAKTDSSKEIKKIESSPKLIDLLSPSTTAVVSSTTTTVTQPLKIEAKFDTSSKDDGSDKGDASVYLPDGRALSATSVSTAMNRMNDTVMDTKTLMKDSNLSSKLSPAATAIISMKSNENSESHQREPVNNSALPPVETTLANNNNNHNNNNNNNNNNFAPPLNRNQSGNSIPSVNSVKNVITEVKPNETNGKGTVVISPERGVGLTDALPKSANERIKEARTMVATDVQPIRITVKEKPSNSEVQSGNIRLPVNATNGINERPGLPPSQPLPPEEPPTSTEPPPKKGICGRLMGCCRKSPKTDTVTIEKEKKKSNLWCCSKNNNTMKEEAEEIRERIDSDTSLIREEVKGKINWWQKLNCCKRNKISDKGLPTAQRKDSWAERTNSYTSETVKKSPKDICKNFFKTIFCINLCTRKRRKEEEALRRKASIMSKKKSLTPPVPPEEPKVKLDAGLVEHSSLMKGAIPVLPVPLAWLCLILNVFLPGIGTIVSGFLCLCMGIPRFSTTDGPRQRVGACIIDFFIGCGQLFTVLFCLVGWGWSIWWGVIMIKIAKKYRKIRRAEKAMEEDSASPSAEENHLTRDPERGS